MVLILLRKVMGVALKFCPVGGAAVVAVLVVALVVAREEVMIQMLLVCQVLGVGAHVDVGVSAAVTVVVVAGEEASMKVMSMISDTTPRNLNSNLAEVENRRKLPHKYSKNESRKWSRVDSLTCDL